MFLIHKACDFMFHGIDISSLTTYEEFKQFYSKASKKLIAVNNDNVDDFTMELPEDVQEIFGVPDKYFLRHGLEFITGDAESIKEEYGIDVVADTVLTKDVLVGVLQLLYKNSVSSFDGIDKLLLDPEFKTKMETIDATFDYKNPQHCQLMDDIANSKIERPFNVMCAIAEFDNELIADLMQYFKTPLQSIGIPSLSDFKVIDNRVYIPLSEADQYRYQQALKSSGRTLDDVDNSLKYIVISKNPYDYFYCSYGSEFQSCFALNSPHAGFYGMFQFATSPSSFIIYGSNGKSASTAIINGEKFKQPYMLWRTWGWLLQNGMVGIDKVYTSREHIFNWCKDFLTSKFGFVVDSGTYTVKNSADLKRRFDKYEMRFYPDSIRYFNSCSTSVKFCRGSGVRDFTGNMPQWLNNYQSYLTKAQQVSRVSDTFDATKTFAVIDGVLMNPKVCPITHRYIDESQEVHPYAKYFKQPVNNFLVLTYDNGNIRGEDNTYSDDVFRIDGYNPEITDSGNRLLLPKSTGSTGKKQIPLAKIKEFLKRRISASAVDAVLLRVIEYDRMQVIKYMK